jgi:phage gpG-like protein
MTTIRIEGTEELIKRIDSLAKLNKVKASIHQAAIFLEGKVKEYPTRSSRPNWMLRGNSDKARRMRAGFFYHLKHGDIEVPYRRGQSPRSEKLGQSWTTQTENQGFRAIIGTGVSYARMVQDSARQTSYHRQTGWITTNQVEKLYGQQAINQIEQALQREVNNG